MKVTKLGHCCMLIEEGSLRILTDPGSYSTAQNEVKNIDLILITHEHQDHVHIESLKTVLKNNPQARIITNKGVGPILDKENIFYKILEHGQQAIMKNVLIEGFGEKHACIYKTWKDVKNTGYFINNKLFYPGDAFYNPQKPVDLLALPVAGPWMKISEAIDYALQLKPKCCFPVHDGMLKIKGGSHKVPEEVLPKNNIQFIIIEEGATHSF